MNSRARTPATLDDLFKVASKAELVAAGVIDLPPTGRKPSRVAFRIARSLDDFAEASGVGEAYADNTGFTVPELASARKSFAPDAAYYVGPFASDEMRFIEGPPTFAVEVRSEGDYGDAAEEAMAAKRADYFEAGTAVVWDVDPVHSLIRKYGADRPDQPETFGAGQVADAEPAVPGWRVAADLILG